MEPSGGPEGSLPGPRVSLASSWDVCSPAQTALLLRAATAVTKNVGTQSAAGLHWCSQLGTQAVALQLGRKIYNLSKNSSNA